MLLFHMVLRLMLSGHRKVIDGSRLIAKKEAAMKTMNCKQLGGACNKEFHANSFEEMAELSKQHGTEMFQQKDEAHLQAMNEMMQLMQKPDAMTAWFESKRKEFEALPESE